MTLTQANLSLRPDVEAAVKSAVASFPEIHNEVEEWFAYEEFKDGLSRICGVDAPARDMDGEQYRLGIESFIRLTKL